MGLLQNLILRLLWNDGELLREVCNRIGIIPAQSRTGYLLNKIRTRITDPVCVEHSMDIYKVIVYILNTRTCIANHAFIE